MTGNKRVYTKQDLIGVREMIAYWTLRRDNAEKMVISFLYEEKVINENLRR